MTAETVEVEFWLAVDDEGNFEISANSALEALNELNHHNNCNAARTYEFKLTLPKPTVTEVSATVPDTAGPIQVTIS